MNLERFLPRASEEYQGSRVAFYLPVLLAVVSTIRSLIHIIAPANNTACSVPVPA